MTNKELVVPAQAGVILLLPWLKLNIHSRSRTSGGDPSIIGHNAFFEESFPHKRG